MTEGGQGSQRAEEPRKEYKCVYKFFDHKLVIAVASFVHHNKQNLYDRSAVVNNKYLSKIHFRQ